MKQKGFTLIELLAVIIILAVLAALVTPKVIVMLREAEQNTKKTSVEGLIKAASYQYANNEASSYNQPTIIDYTNGTNLDYIDYKGEKPTGGQVKISINGDVSVAVKIGDECYKKSANSTEITVSQYLERTCKINQIVTIITQQIPGRLTPGDEVAIGDEHFYVISSNSKKTNLITKYNLNVGYNLQDEQYGAIGMQNSHATAFHDTQDGNGYYAASKEFASSEYWVDANHNVLNKYPTKATSELFSTTTNVYDIYDENSNLYTYVENYVDAIEELGLEDVSGRLLNYDEIIELGCDDLRVNSCPTFLLNTDYYLGSATVNSTQSFVWHIRGDMGDIVDNANYENPIDGDGVRPVITINTSEF